MYLIFVILRFNIHVVFDGFMILALFQFRHFIPKYRKMLCMALHGFIVRLMENGPDPY